MLAREIVARFHSAGRRTRRNRTLQIARRGGVPDEIPEVTLEGAPLAMGDALKQAGLVHRTVRLRMIEQGGVRIDGAVVSDKALKVVAGT